MIEVKFLRLAHGADLPPPDYASAGAAGLDLRAAVPIDSPIIIPSGGRALIPTGVAIELPPDHEAQVRPRSGLAANHGVTVLNSPGTVDADYRGEIKVALINHGAETFTVSRGMRIAQLVVAPIARVFLVESASLKGTDRGGRGFGSTGAL